MKHIAGQNVRKGSTMKKFLKIVSLLAVVAMMFALVAGCAKEEPKTDVGEPDNDTDVVDSGNTDELTGWAYIEDKGTLIVGLDDTFAPMGFRDENDNLIGFDIDLAEAVAAELGIEVEFQRIDWDAKEMELSSKRIDCIWNGMSATEERQESMSLSKKYINNCIVIAALEGSDINITSVDDLANYTIATQEGSAALEVLEADAAYDSFSANLTTYPTYDEAILDMQAGRIQVMVVDQVLVGYKNTKLDDGSKLVVSDFNFGDDYYAIGCRKGEDDLAEKINGAIQTLIDNGKAAEISEKWFDTNIVILEDYE